jgi:hypothetical protein
MRDNSFASGVGLALLLAFLPCSASADLLVATDVETPCADVPARMCKAVGSVIFQPPRILGDSATENTGDWRWVVVEGDFDDDGINDDIQVGTLNAFRHRNVHAGEAIGALLSLTFTDVVFGVAQGPKVTSGEHGSHFDNLLADISVVNGGLGIMSVNVEFTHDPSRRVVPEPSTYLLLGAGLLGILGWARRQRRRA